MASKTQEDRATSPLMTNRPWLVVGLPRTTWFRLRSADLAPLPVDMPGRQMRYRIKDLLAWVEAMPSTRRRHQLTRKAKAA